MAGIKPPQGGLLDRANTMMGMASNSYGMQQRKLQTPGAPAKTVGGAIGAGVGMAAAGATIGSFIGGGAAAGSSAGPVGAAVGAIAGLAAYFLS